MDTLYVLCSVVFFCVLKHITSTFRYPCLYGFCKKTARDRTANWQKGADRTSENLLEDHERYHLP